MNSYRPDIDGLRAIAVILVILFHADVSLFSGGFVGVDVFFVLTGYLISTLILKELNAGTFRFKNFFLRRIRRLFPALITVVLVTIVFGYYILLPEDLTSLLDSSRYTLLSVGNLYFYLNTGGYFSPNAHDLPLLHTWSLGVEEQFYLIWPIVLVLLYKYVDQGLWLRIALFSTVIALAVSQVSANYFPQAGYYFLGGRAFEILIGAVIAFALPNGPRISKSLSTLLSIAGLIMILCSALILTNRSAFPGLNALWPCIGTAMVLYAGTNKASPGVIQKILGSPPFVFIGVLSYSIYLWHWPVIVYANYLDIYLPIPKEYCFLILSVLLSYLTYVIIERPIRYARKIGFGIATVGLLVIPLTLVWGAYSFVEKNNGLPNRLPTDDNLAFSRAELLCIECIVNGENHRAIGAENENWSGFLAGDSYADMYEGFLDILATDSDMTFGLAWYPTTFPVPGVSAGHRPDQDIIRYTIERHELLKKYHYAVLAGSWGSYIKKERFGVWDSSGTDVTASLDDLLIHTISDLESAGVKVILIDRPFVKPGADRMRVIRANRIAGMSASNYVEERKPRDEEYLINRIRRQLPNVVIIEPFDALCTEVSCNISIDGQVVFSQDGHHLTDQGSYNLGKLYLEKFPNPLKDL